MTQDEITAMAREAGFKPHHNPDLYDCMVASEDAIERFAALVVKEAERKASFDKAELWIKRISEAVLAEREACAKVCDHMAARCNDIRAAALESAAENIRARSDK